MNGSGSKCKGKKSCYKAGTLAALERPSGGRVLADLHAVPAGWGKQIHGGQLGRSTAG